MSGLDMNHPLAKAYRAWKKWEAIQLSGRTQSSRQADDGRPQSATDHATSGLPEPASLAELQFWGEMKNAYEARFEDDLRKYLTANPGSTRASVEQELDSLIHAAQPG